MTATQIENVKALCAGNPVWKVKKLLFYYPQSDINDMAEHLGCPADEISVANALASID